MGHLAHRERVDLDHYPTDQGWKFDGTVEAMMHQIHMFDRKGALDLEGFERRARTGSSSTSPTSTTAGPSW
jgi:hypothetical protein